MNIYDVAKYSGVSRSTVSRVLSGGIVKEKTRQKVLAAIEELGYTPNTSAQKLAGGRNNIIGIITGTPISDPFFAHMNDLINREGLKRGYNSIYVVASDDEVNLSREIAMLYGKVDCFVIMGCLSGGLDIQKDVEKLVQLGMPVAVFKSGPDCEGALTVDVNNELGGYLAGEYIADKGYRRIAYMGGSGGVFLEGRQRREGFYRALNERGLTVMAEYDAKREFRAAYSMADEILGSGADIVFCETDLMAYGLTQALFERAVPVPERLAVMGFDNLIFTNYQTQIQLTTVAQPFEEMAESIVECLVNRIEKNMPYPMSMKMDPVIVERSTT